MRRCGEAHFYDSSEDHSRGSFPRFFPAVLGESADMIGGESADGHPTNWTEQYGCW